jgi:undecaprenyl-diphosphatase
LDFLSIIKQLDTEALLWIQSFHSPFWDEVMFYISGKLIWFPLYTVLIVALWRKYHRQFWIPLLAVVLAVVTSDMIASWVFKPTVKRFRPSHEPALVEQLHLVKNNRGGTYGFFSSHAATTFAIAVFFVLVFNDRKAIYGLLFWASMVSLSRVYLGLHYPGDIAAGIFCGTVVGFSFFFLTQNFLKRKEESF